MMAMRGSTRIGATMASTVEVREIPSSIVEATSAPTPTLATLTTGRSVAFVV